MFFIESNDMTDQTRSPGGKQLDDGIGNALVQVGVSQQRVVLDVAVEVVPKLYFEFTTFSNEELNPARNQPCFEVEWGSVCGMSSANAVLMASRRSKSPNGFSR